MIIVAGASVVVWQLLTGFGESRSIFEGLSVSAPVTQLHVGESTQLSVAKKRAFIFRQSLPPSDTTTYFTTNESALVVELDGRITAVGTRRLPTYDSWVSAGHGRDSGHIAIGLLATGPGPTLDFVAVGVTKPESIPDYLVRDGPCCSGDPIIMTEGQTIRYKLVQRGTPSEDLTTRAKYTVFFGSGVPNDIRPSIVTGGPDYVTFRTFVVSGEYGTISAPSSIGRSNRARIVVFARYGNLVGWRSVIVTHVEDGGREDHLRRHPNER